MAAGTIGTLAGMEIRAGKNKKTRRKRRAFQLDARWLSVVDGFLNGVLNAANHVLNLAGGFLRLAFTFELGVPGYNACDFFHFAFRLFGAALNAIFIHRVLVFLNGVSIEESTSEHQGAFHAGNPAMHSAQIAYARLCVEAPRQPLGAGHR